MSRPPGIPQNVIFHFKIIWKVPLEQHHLCTGEMLLKEEIKKEKPACNEFCKKPRGERVWKQKSCSLCWGLQALLPALSQRSSWIKVQPQLCAFRAAATAPFPRWKQEAKQTWGTNMNISIPKERQGTSQSSEGKLLSRNPSSLSHPQSLFA